MLARSTSYRANLINAVQIAEQRGWQVVERHDKRSVHTDSIRIDVETDGGVTSVEGGGAIKVIAAPAFGRCTD